MEDASALAPRFDVPWTDAFPWTRGPLHAALVLSSFPIFTPLHRAARRVLVRRELAALARWSREEFGDVRWEPRHSSLSVGEFRLFQSDIDLAAIFRRCPTQDDLNRLSERFRARRRRSPLLGEVEVYTEAEWRVRNRMRALPAVAALLQLLWDFRKMHWVETALESKSHGYHRLKSENALANSWKKLGERAGFPRRRNLGDGFRNKLASVFSSLGLETDADSRVPRDVRYFCDYLACDFDSTERPAGPREVILPAVLSAKLLAVLPPTKKVDAQLAPCVDDLRRLPAIRRARSFVLLSEYLVVRSRQRTHPATADANEGWLRELRQELSSCGPIDWRGLAE